MKVLVTGSNGLIGSEAVEHFDRQGFDVFGLDNNMRALFFGPEGDTLWNLRRLQASTRRFTHFDLDIRDREGIFRLFREHRFDGIFHCAAQPSHDKSREIPLLDFEVNALGTLHLLEATRQFCPEAVFIQMSTNKVYGTAPNEMPLNEGPTRYDYARPEDFHGVDESCRIDQSRHTPFGASKTAGDLLAQEYGRSYGLKVGVFRGGCLTGPAHSGVALHGFLSHLVKTAVRKKPYTVYGYKGKQVRDQIHSHDVVRAMEEFSKAPRPGEVYNLGGGRANSISVLEAISVAEKVAGRMEWKYKDQARSGDHLCYISDTRKFQSHFPAWAITRSLETIFEDLVKTEWENARTQTA